MTFRSAIPEDPTASPPGPKIAVADRTDAELLEAFAGSRCEEVFGELVRRHGPMVMGVCRRQLGNRQDAEDAFQVAFLVLAKNAGSVRKPHLLGSWLFGVARRVARKAQQANARRMSGQTRLIHMLSSTRSDPDPPAELLAFLEEEIERLPSQYRAAVVMCYLEGKTNREAARILGWPEGTLVTRLTRAKEALRTRAASKGMTLSAAAIGAALTQHFAPASAVPAALVSATAKAATVHAAGHGLSAVVSAKALSMLHDTGRAILWTKFQLAALVTLGVLLLGTGATFVAMRYVGGRDVGLSVNEAELRVPVPAMKTANANVALLKAVQKMRAAALAGARWGSGVAQDDGAYDDLGSDRTVPDRRGVIRFAFSPERFLTRVQFPEEPTVALGYAGVKDRVLAFRSLPPETPVAQISRLKGSTLDHKPLDWSVAQIARISPWGGDDEFFSYLLTDDRGDVEWRIERDGPVVRLLIENRHGGAFAQRIAGSRMLVEFDTGHHAMTSLFRFERDAANESGARRTEIQRHQISWRSVGEAEVPVERRVVLASREGDAVKVRSVSVVKFHEYSLGPVPSSMLDPDLLGIPDGTPVNDQEDPPGASRVWKGGGFR